jgi:hypothetical protein
MVPTFPNRQDYYIFTPLSAPGDEFGLHHAGYSADAQGSAHQAGECRIEGCTGEGEYVGGDQCQDGEGE